MADIPNRKFFALIGDARATPSFPPDNETPQSPVTPPGTGIGGAGTVNRLTKWVGPGTIGDSQVFDNGTDVGVGTDSPTNTLDVNGTLRVRTINNLGTAATNVLVPDATGVLHLRTLAQFATDLGVINIPLPDGLVTVGSAVQAGADITYGTNWVWRISGVEYSSASPETISFPAAALGFIRRDLVVGNSSGLIYRVAGAAVPDTEPAIAPAVPAGTVALQDVLVDSAGITSFTNFALATFVRFDINNQGLNAVQRFNARTNIQSVGLDNNETISGTKTFTSRFTLFRVGVAASIPNFLRIEETGGRTRLRLSRNGTYIPEITANNNTFYLGTQKGSSVVYGIHLDNQDRIHLGRASNGNGYATIPSGALIRSWQAHYFDFEANLLGLVTRVTTFTETGILNDFDIGRASNVRFTLADEITGLLATLIGHQVTVQNDNTVSLTLRHQNSGSVAANRMLLPGAVDLVVPTKGKVDLIYCTGSRWELKSKNF